MNYQPVPVRHSAAFGHNCRWEPRALPSHVKRAGPLSPLRQRPGDAQEGVCKHVHLSRVGLGCPNLQTAGRGAARENSPNVPTLPCSKVVCSAINFLIMAVKNPSVLHGQLPSSASGDAAWAKLPAGFYVQKHFVMDCITSLWMCWIYWGQALSQTYCIPNQVGWAMSTHTKGTPKDQTLRSRR